jgi:hypothetical protein
VAAPAAARLAPKPSALAGMLGKIPYSAVEKRKDGRKTGNTKLRLANTWLGELTAQLSQRFDSPDL